MAKYEAQVTVTITRTYEVVLQVEAQHPTEAADKLNYQALGMKQAEVDRHCENEVNSYYDGEETTVVGLGQIEEVPDGE